MTIGDKIQYYRKQKGLSQEELGQLLTVSRQTVSQWETGQTSPTVDNLVRLKEVLGISVDALLSSGDDVPKETREVPQEEAPLERYETRMNEAEAKALLDRMSAPRKRERICHIAFVLICLAFFILFFRFVMDEIWSAVFFSVFIVVLEIYWTLGYRKYLAKLCEIEKRFFDSVMVFSLYEDHIVVSERENGKEISAHLFKYGDLHTACEIDGFYVFYTEGEPLRLRGSLVAPGSRMEGFFREVCTKTERELLDKKQHIYFLLGSVLSFASIMGTCIFALYPYSIYPRPWVMALAALPGVAISASSFGHVLFWLRRGKRRLKSDLVPRSVFVVLAVIIGICGYCNAVEFYESEEYRTLVDALEFAEELENITGMELPAPEDAYMEERIPSADTMFISKASAFDFRQRDLDRLLRAQADGRDVWLKYEAFWTDRLLGDFFYPGDEYPDRAAYYNVTESAWNTLTGAGDYLLFFCDYDESIVYVYAIEFPEEADSFFSPEV